MHRDCAAGVIEVVKPLTEDALTVTTALCIECCHLASVDLRRKEGNSLRVRQHHMRRQRLQPLHSLGDLLEQ